MFQKAIASTLSFAKCAFILLLPIANDIFWILFDALVSTIKIHWHLLMHPYALIELLSVWKQACVFLSEEVGVMISNLGSLLHSLDLHRHLVIPQPLIANMILFNNPSDRCSFVITLLADCPAHHHSL